MNENTSYENECNQYDDEIVNNQQLSEMRKYDDSSFWEKIQKYASVAGKEIIQKSLIAYYCAKDPDTPAKARGSIYGALAYFIMPIDVIPDVLISAGYTDDIAILAAALGYIAVNIKDVHKQKAKEQVNSIFS